MFALAYVCISGVSLTILRLNNIKPRRKSLLIATFFAIFAFFIVPTTIGNNLDMVRYFNDLNVFRSYRELSGIKNTLSFMYSYPIGGSVGVGGSGQSTYGGIPGTLLLMFVLSYLPNNLLLSFVAFIVIYCSIRLMGSVSKQYNNSQKMLVVTGFLFFALLPFMRVLSGFRTFIVAAAFSYCVWSNLVYKQKKIVFGIVYLFLILIHPFIALPILFLVLTTFFFNNKVLIRCLDVIMLCSHLFQNIFVNILSKLTFIPFFSSVLIKNNQYVNTNAFSTNDLVRNLIQLFIVVTIFICTLLWSHTNKKYNEFMILLLSFTLGSLYSPVIFGRYVTLLLFTFIPYLCLMSVWEYPTSREARVAQTLVIIFVFIISLLILIDNLRAGLVYVQLGI